MSKRQRRYSRSQIIALFLMTILLFIGVLLTFLPKINSLEEQRHIEQEVQLFQEEVRVIQQAPGREQESDSSISKTVNVDYMKELRETMEEYNRTIFENGQEDLVDAWSYQAKPFDMNAFEIEGEAVGILSIPTIDVELPIYLGATDTNLGKGCAVLTQTSMPIGGENTNCVIAAHRGWNEIPFVRDIEKVMVGDSIIVENYWQTLEYRVTETRIIYPYEYENILIQPGKDMITIVTCHPYHVNTYRYLVYAERYEQTTHATQPAAEWITETQTTAVITVSEGIDFQSSQTKIFLYSWLPVILLGVAAALLLILLLADALKSKKIKKNHHQNGAQ